MVPQYLVNRAERRQFTTEEAAELCAAIQEENGYLLVHPINSEEYVLIHKFMFTWAIMTGLLWMPDILEDRWCYSSLQCAAAALTEWGSRGYEGEPQGWHRHPKSGRRRVNGDPDTEYIQH